MLASKDSIILEHIQRTNRLECHSFTRVLTTYMNYLTPCRVWYLIYLSSHKHLYGHAHTLLTHFYFVIFSFIHSFTFFFYSFLFKRYTLLYIICYLTKAQVHNKLNTYFIKVCVCVCVFNKDHFVQWMTMIKEGIKRLNFAY